MLSMTANSLQLHKAMQITRHTQHVFHPDTVPVKCSKGRLPSLGLNPRHRLQAINKRLPCRVQAADDGTPDHSTNSVHTAAAQPSNVSSPHHNSAATRTSANGSSNSSSNSKHFSLLNLLPPSSSLKLMSTSIELLKRNLWAVILLYLVKDGAAFILHRVSQRLTNLLADTFLGTNISATTNPWWLLLDASFMESNPGYQVCIVLLFLAALPLNILLSSGAGIAAAHLCVPKSTRRAIKEASDHAKERAEKAAHPIGPEGVSVEDVSARKVDAEDLISLAAGNGFKLKGQQGLQDSNDSSSEDTLQGQQQSSPFNENGSESPNTANGTSTSTAEKPQGIFKSASKALSDIRAVIPIMMANLKRVWWVEILFTIRALPLQALSLLVFPVPWTVPRLLSIQMSVPAAVLEGHEGKAALTRSSQLMSTGKDLMAAYGWPFVGLVLLLRAMDSARNIALALIPMRWWQDVVEVPLIITAGFAFTKMLIMRLQDLLPLAAYLVAFRREQGHPDSDGKTIKLPAPPTSVPTI